MSAKRKYDFRVNPGTDADERARRRLAALSPPMLAARAELRHVDYAQAERDCELLAAEILVRYAGSDIHDFRFVAIPRGGLIVLGMLSYILDLPAARLGATGDPGRPLCIVDDCALTGARFAAALREHACGHVVFAHLYSSPDLRRAILEREHRVRHCFSARDLADTSQRFFSSDAERSNVEKRWWARTRDDRYWYGHTELVSFAWSEPDYPFWDATEQRWASGWRFTPPHRCLKNKWSLGVAPAHHQPSQLRLADAVVYAEFDDVFWLCDSGADRVYVLADSAADMLAMLLTYDDAASAARSMTTRYDATEAVLQRDFRDFRQRLIDDGLLVSG